MPLSKQLMHRGLFAPAQRSPLSAPQLPKKRDSILAVSSDPTHYNATGRRISLDEPEVVETPFGVVPTQHTNRRSIDSIMTDEEALIAQEVREHVSRRQATQRAETENPTETSDEETDGEPLGETVPDMLVQKLRSFPLFSEAPMAFFLKIKSRLKFIQLNAQEYIVKAGEPSKSMYWILKGTVGVTSPDGEALHAELAAGSFFGEIGILFNRPRTATVVSRTRVLLGVLTAEALNSVLPSYPIVERRIRDEAQERLAMQEKKRTKDLPMTIPFYAKRNSVIWDSPHFAAPPVDPHAVYASHIAMAADPLPGPSLPPISHFVGPPVPSPRLNLHVFESDSTKPVPVASFERTSLLYPYPSVDSSISTRAFLQNLSVFQTLPPSIIHQLALEAEPLYYEPFNYVFDKGDKGSDIFFVVSGDVEVIDRSETPRMVTASGEGECPIDDTDPAVHPEITAYHSHNIKDKVLARLGPGNYFGEMAFLKMLTTGSEIDSVRTACIRTVTTVELIVVRSAKFFTLCKKYPLIFEDMRMTAMMRTERNDSFNNPYRLTGEAVSTETGLAPPISPEAGSTEQMFLGSHSHNRSEDGRGPLAGHAAETPPAIPSQEPITSLAPPASPPTEALALLVTVSTRPPALKPDSTDLSTKPAEHAPEGVEALVTSPAAMCAPTPQAASTASSFGNWRIPTTANLPPFPPERTTSVSPHYRGSSPGSRGPSPHDTHKPITPSQGTLLSSGFSFNESIFSSKKRRADSASPTDASHGAFPGHHGDHTQLSLTTPPMNPPVQPVNVFANRHNSASHFQYMSHAKRMRLASVSGSSGRRRSSVLAAGILPDRILLRVFSFMSLPELMGLRKICRRWRQLLMVAPNILHDLDLTPWNTSIDDRAVIAITDFVGTRPRSVDISNCFHITDEGFSYMVNGIGIGGRLQAIKMRSTWEISAMAIMDLAVPSIGSHLESIDLSNCRKVRDDVIERLLSWNGPQNKPLLQEAVNNSNAHPGLLGETLPEMAAFDAAQDTKGLIGCAKLKALNLGYCKHLTDRTIYHIAMFANTQIVSLDLTRCTTITDAGFAYWAYQPFPNLTTLKLKDCTFLSDKSVILIASSAKNLQLLDLSFCCSLSDVSIEVLCLGCPQLTDLSLSFCGLAVSDPSLLAISSHLRNLTHLHAKGCVRVTRAGIDALLSGVSPLEYLDVSQCRNAHIYPGGFAAQPLVLKPGERSLLIAAGPSRKVTELVI